MEDGISELGVPVQRPSDPGTVPPKTVQKGKVAVPGGPLSLGGVLDPGGLTAAHSLGGVFRDP